ncbi:hypothetical protein [Novipirellula rosea]|uniref:Uncharacterized protein n=1 Tax=Novipirellula rosea TaxID=1031540 RepID=A0ABP8NQ40_9BACT
MEVNESSFGILIAYVIPGWIVLLGFSYGSDTIATWLTGSVATSPTIGGFLFATLASIGLGVIVSTVRWLVVDPVMHLTGVQPDDLGFVHLQQSHNALTILVNGHYRYYQFHANLCVALPFAATFRWIYGKFQIEELFGVVVVFAVLLLGARDTLQKYYVRCGQVLGSR